MVDLALRAQPLHKRGRERVDELIATAMSMVGVGGPDALSTTELADRAGVSIGTVYRYFPDKERILGALAHALILETTTALERALARKALLDDFDQLGPSGCAEVLVDVLVERLEDGEGLRLLCLIEVPEGTWRDLGEVVAEHLGHLGQISAPAATLACRLVVPMVQTTFSPPSRDRAAALELAHRGAASILHAALASSAA